MLSFREQGDELSCCGQINLPQVPELAAAGYHAIVCNRPDSEEGSIDSAAIAKAASDDGMASVCQPVGFSKLSLTDGEAFVRAQETPPALMAPTGSMAS